MEQRLFSGQETLRQEAMKREQHLSDLQDGFWDRIIYSSCVVFERLDDYSAIVTGWWLVSNLCLGCCSKASSNCHAESASINTGTCTGAMKKRRNVSLILIPSIFFFKVFVSTWYLTIFADLEFTNFTTHFGILFLHTQVYQPISAPMFSHVFKCRCVAFCEVFWRELPALWG